MTTGRINQVTCVFRLEKVTKLPGVALGADPIGDARNSVDRHRKFQNSDVLHEQRLDGRLSSDDFARPANSVYLQSGDEITERSESEVHLDTITWSLAACRPFTVNARSARPAASPRRADSGEGAQALRSTPRPVAPTSLFPSRAASQISRSSSRSKRLNFNFCM